MAVIRAIGRFIRNIVVGAPISHDELGAYTDAESERLRYGTAPGAEAAQRFANNSFGNTMPF